MPSDALFPREIPKWVRRAILLLKRVGLLFFLKNIIRSAWGSVGNRAECSLLGAGEGVPAVEYVNSAALLNSWWVEHSPAFGEKIRLFVP